MQICITTMAIVAAYLLAQYAITHTFTIATVGCVAVGAFITSCVWLTVHDQVSPGCRGPGQFMMGRCAVRLSVAICKVMYIVKVRTSLTMLVWPCKLAMQIDAGPA